MHHIETLLKITNKNGKKIMPFTEEQEQQILNLLLPKTSANDTEQKPAEAQKAPAKSVVDEAKDAVVKEKQAEIALSQIQSAVKFNLSIKDFVEKNKTILPDESSKILSAVESKIFNSDIDKANSIRKNLIESFLEKKENIEVLTESMKTRAESFKALAESDKERKSGEFWDLVEIGVSLKHNISKAKELNKINGFTEGSGNKLEQKILAKAAQKFNFQLN